MGDPRFDACLRLAEHQLRDRQPPQEDITALAVHLYAHGFPKHDKQEGDAIVIPFPVGGRRGVKSNG